MFLASAQGMLKMAKRRYVMTKTGLRPHCSLNGACVRESASQPRAREPRESEREEVEAHPEERAEREPLRGTSSSSSARRTLCESDRRREETHEDEERQAQGNDDELDLEVGEELAEAARVDGRAERDAERRDGRVGGDEPAGEEREREGRSAGALLVGSRGSRRGDAPLLGRGPVLRVLHLAVEPLDDLGRALGALAVVGARGAALLRHVGAVVLCDDRVGRVVLVQGRGRADGHVGHVQQQCVRVRGALGEREESERCHKGAPRAPRFLSAVRPSAPSEVGPRLTRTSARRLRTLTAFPSTMSLLSSCTSVFTSALAFDLLDKT